MTDYGLVKEELAKLLHCGGALPDEYASYINNAVASVAAVLKNPEDDNDVRVINLCAVKAYYQIVLSDNTDDGITSFTAGDVSYTKDTSSVSRAKALLDLAVSDCTDLVNGGGFAFKVV